MRPFVLAALAACSGVQSNPARTALASGLSGTGLAMCQDASRLYFIELDSTSYRLLALAKQGGATEEIASGTPIGVVAADDAGLYWIDYDGTHARVWVHTPDGATRMLAGDAGVATGLPTRAGLDAQSLYYADNAGTVWRIARDTGAATMLGTTDAGPAAVALDGADVWVATKHGAKLLPSTELSLSLTPPVSVAAAYGAVFAVVSGSGGSDGTVVRGATGTAPATVLSGLVSPYDAVPDGGTLYVATTFGIHTVPEAGGDDTAFGEHTSATTVMLDAARVYWSDGSGVYASPR